MNRNVVIELHITLFIKKMPFKIILHINVVTNKRANIINVKHIRSEEKNIYYFINLNKNTLFRSIYIYGQLKFIFVFLLSYTPISIYYKT